MRLVRIIVMLHLLLFIAVFTSTAQSHDADGDGVPDPDDKCPTEPGPRTNGGCPLSFVNPSPVDSDGDGLPDSEDKCPKEAGPRTHGGCPLSIVNPSPIDTDGDDLPDPDDRCPTVAGPRTNHGCPVSEPPQGASDEIAAPTDTDGDGIPDHSDLCPTLAGSVNNQGCPETEPTPFAPPLLSNDACFVTTSGDYRARVRVLPDIEAEMIGYLVPGVVYPALGIVKVGDEEWVKLPGQFEYFDYGLWGSTKGYVSDLVVLTSNCPQLPVFTIDDFAIAEDEDTGTAILQSSIHDYVCTVVTAFEWTFAFNYAPEEDIPVGAHPLAILNGDLDLAGDVNNWTAINKTYGDSEYEYMDYPGWASFPRTGGNCGTIGDATISTLGIFVPEPDNPLQVGTHIGIVVQTAFSDCNENGIDDLDEFFPPDCFGKLTANTGGGDTADLSQDDIDFLWVICPEGWIVDQDKSVECHDFELDDE